MDVKLSRTPLNTDTSLIQTLFKAPSVFLLTRVDSVLKSGADFLFQVSTTTTVTSHWKFHLMPAAMVKLTETLTMPTIDATFATWFWRLWKHSNHHIPVRFNKETCWCLGKIHLPEIAWWRLSEGPGGLRCFVHLPTHLQEATLTKYYHWLSCSLSLYFVTQERCLNQNQWSSEEA